MDSYMGLHMDPHMNSTRENDSNSHWAWEIGNFHAKFGHYGSCNNYAGRDLLPTHELEFLIINLLASLAALHGLQTLCVRWEKPSGVSKNNALQPTDLSRPLGSSSTYKYLQFLQFTGL